MSSLSDATNLMSLADKDSSAINADSRAWNKVGQHVTHQQIYRSLDTSRINMFEEVHRLETLLLSDITHATLGRLLEKLTAIKVDSRPRPLLFCIRHCTSTQSPTLTSRQYTGMSLISNTSRSTMMSEPGHLWYQSIACSQQHFHLSNASHSSHMHSPNATMTVQLLDLPCEILTLIFREVCRLEPPGDLGFTVPIRYMQRPPFLSGQEYRNHIKNNGIPKPGLQSLLTCCTVSKEMKSIVERTHGELIKAEQNFFIEFKKWQRMEIIGLRSWLFTTEECAVRLMSQGRSPYFECEGPGAAPWWDDVLQA